MRRIIWIALGLASVAPAQELQLASLGDFRLESGQIIRNCKIGYRTFGKLAPDRSNAIVFPTWFTGTTKQLAGMMGPGNVVDTSRYFVIAVDAIGDGDSTSPSNSTEQPRMQFPKFSIRDMVESQHRLLTETLHLSHLYAVMGISMGGMQTFQWAVSYPEFFDKGIPIVGSPRLTSYDLLLWEGELHVIEEDAQWNGGNYQSQPALKALADMHTLALTTPEYQVAQTPPAKFDAYLKGVEQNGPDRFDANNWHRQLEAMISHDVAAPYGGSMEQAAARVKAKLLVIVSAQDHMVNPTPARNFAQLTKARVVELTGPCGHLANGCEKDKVIQAVSDFLTGPRSDSAR
jgi:homoserine O-acetyltransferase